MKTDNTLSVIRQKIEDLPNVVMYSMNQHGVKFPSDIIDFVRIDDDDQLWFISHLSNRLLNECDQIFPVRLHFFKKDIDHFVEISGRATIMSEISQPELFAPEDDKIKHPVLIKMTMNNIEYTELNIILPKSKLRLFAEWAYKWLVQHLSLDRHHGSTLEKSH